ncbi:MAG TPA: hypothetical protein VF302_10365, partial [Candidatus Limnocylindrales bacterium]
NTVAKSAEIQTLVAWGPDIAVPPIKGSRRASATRDRRPVVRPTSGWREELALVHFLENGPPAT